MAIRLASSSSECLLIDQSLARSDFTIMAWWYGVSLSGWGNIFYFSNDGGGLAALQTDGTTLNTSAGSGSTVAAATWYHLALVNDASANHYGYLNGVLDCQDYGDRINGGDWLYAQIGRWSASSDYPNSRFAAIKIYQAALTADQIKQEMWSIRPRRTANLFAWFPTFPGNGIRTLDYSGYGRDLTEVGTPADEDQPPVSWGADRPRIWTVGGVAGGISLPVVIHHLRQQGIA